MDNITRSNRAKLLKIAKALSADPNQLISSTGFLVADTLNHKYFEPCDRAIIDCIDNELYGGVTIECMHLLNIPELITFLLLIRESIA